ncbi:IS493-like transposase [Streptomyces microflavus DSM 40593]|uniref:IS493-like transposase n=1 Tax=Streptomyces microflavus DSM 40593 TaxID=1303692 RepID=N0CG77_STRMI|nr:IS493-like transposase [Streptomyces microflavus DSM 40593]
MAFTMPVILLVLQRSFRRRRQPLRVAMACSPRRRILAWLLL